eukprot:1591515-Amphidinium_carterae.1
MGICPSSHLLVGMGRLCPNKGKAKDIDWRQDGKNHRRAKTHRKLENSFGSALDTNERSRKRGKHYGNSPPTQL